VRETVVFESPAFAVDREARTITGMLLPFGKVSRPARDRSSGALGRYTFAAGTVEVPDVDTDEMPVILNYGHDNEKLEAQVGIATSLTLTDGGVLSTWRIAKTPEGDRVLALADPEVRILRQFSAEVDGTFELRDGVHHAKTTRIIGGAVVLRGAFGTDAQITSVAASAVPEKEETRMTVVTDETTEVVAFSQAEGTKLVADVQALSEQIAELKNITIPVGPGTVEVKEEAIYRFHGTEGAPSGFDFATDLLAAGRDGDKAALARIRDFTAQHLSPSFIDTTDTSNVNAPTYRPDMFLGQSPTPASPLYDFFHKGGLKDVTPFFWSKLDRTNTNVAVGDHTEGTDPTAKDLVTVVGVTVTPTPVSGKVHITREVGDQGGNPQVSKLVWDEFERSFKIALETKTAALVNAATVTELGAAITAGATDGGAVGQIVEAGLVGLQFIPDGFRFERAFGHVDLYKLLAAATKGADNRDKLYPIINPQNATGQAASKWSRLDIGGYGMYPTASLGATNVNQKSYVADPNAVHVWNSGLQRLEKLQESVEGWDMGVFAYFAGVVYDTDGLRKITYDVTA
jgi:hypothetical protein